jgi:hypothetical protein
MVIFFHILAAYFPHFPTEDLMINHISDQKLPSFEIYKNYFPCLKNHNIIN